MIQNLIFNKTSNPSVQPLKDDTSKVSNFESSTQYDEHRRNSAVFLESWLLLYKMTLTALFGP